MCMNQYVEGCGCYATRQEFDADTARIAAASAVEHQIIALLRGEDIAKPSPVAVRLAAHLRGRPDAAAIDDLMTNATGTALWYWIDGDQREARFESSALRLAA